MHILISGGAGFIGSHLADRFLFEGHQVTLVDNLITGSLDNIAHLRQHPAVTFIEHDITQPFNPPGEFDAVLNFASPASPSQTSPRSYLQLPIETLVTGAVGTQHMLDIAHQHNARFLQASTSEVYGDPQVHPQTEDYWGHVNPIGPRSVYDEAKRYAEALTMAYHRKYDLNTHIVRIFNTYGPRMDIHDGRAVPSFMKQALARQPLSVYGDGGQTRSFCYISDLVDGIIRLLWSDEHLPTNIGNPTEITILELAQTINALTDNPGGLIYENLRTVDDPERRRPDISKARRVLNWQPQVELREGLQHTLAYFAALHER